MATKRRSPPRRIRRFPPRKDVSFSFCLMARTKKGCAIVTLSALARSARVPCNLHRALRTFLQMHAHSRCVPSLSLFLFPPISLRSRAAPRHHYARRSSSCSSTSFAAIAFPSSLFSSSSSSTAIIHRDRCAPIYLYRNAPARRRNLERSG